MAMSIVHRKGQEPVSQMKSGRTVEYYLTLEECDELIKELWQVLGFTPAYVRTFLLMRKQAMAMYTEANLHQILE